MSMKTRSKRSFLAIASVTTSRASWPSLAIVTSTRTLAPLLCSMGTKLTIDVFEPQHSQDHLLIHLIVFGHQYSNFSSLRGSYGFGVSQVIHPLLRMRHHSNSLF